MRPIVRAPLLAAALLLGIPGGALVLARLGFIELPPDTYVSSVAPSGADAAGSGTGLRVLERLDTMPT
ncbi:MAG TPA: hypothetical protein VMN60_03410, partial [Longimicrobiales bacterium]|nr:hypothetical protein [Longimicrobiales bacterium]